MNKKFQIFSESQLPGSWLGLSHALNSFQSYWQNEVFQDMAPETLEDLALVKEFKDLITRTEAPFSRHEFTPGHITGSAVLLNQDWSKILLTHHRKLDKWLQLGGHSDGSAETHLVAYREGLEESGLKELNLVQLPNAETIKTVIPFDLDIHKIPARKSEPEHLHYDVRFILTGSDQVDFEISDESNDLKWFTLEEGKKANPERSMQRQFEKIEALISLFG